MLNFCCFSLALPPQISLPVLREICIIKYGMCTEVFHDIMWNFVGHITFLATSLYMSKISRPPIKKNKQKQDPLLLSLYLLVFALQMNRGINIFGVKNKILCCYFVGVSLYPLLGTSWDEDVWRWTKINRDEDIK